MADGELLNQVLVEDTHCPGDRAHGQFRLPRNSELACDHDIQRNVQSLGNRESDGNAAAGQCDNHGVLRDLVESELIRQHAARFETICKWKMNHNAPWA